MTKQKGGKVLGQGSYGCVISPPILCSSKINKLNKVSKLINLTNASKAEYDEAINEYKSGEIFKKVDPNNMYFLPGIDLCEITDKDKNITKQNQKDIEKCGFKDNKQTFLLNILMKKGDDFPKITKELNETNFLKSLAYVLNGANKSIYDLNICLLDIKGDNILYSKDDDSEEIYPVFIDFSDNFVIKSGDEFINFIRDFSPQLPYYPTWGLEISILFLDYFIDNYYRNTKKYNKKRQNFYQEIWDYKKIDFTVENGKNMYKNILDYINKEIKTKRGFLGFFNKIMIYSIGVSYYESFMKSKIKNNKYINDLLLSMMRENIIYRPYINDILSLIKSKIKYKTREDLLISLKDEKKKKQI
jgi:hypothetical protein